MHRDFQHLLLISACMVLVCACGTDSARRGPLDASSDTSEHDAADVVERDASADLATEDGTSSDTAQLPDGGLSVCGCVAGEGTFCGDRAQALALAGGCTLPVGEPASDELLRCAGDAWSVVESCSAECEMGEVDGTDACSLPWCDCFVQVSWCGASAARHGLTLDPPCRVPLVPEHDQDVLACDGPTWIVKEPCSEGCYEAPTGTPDACLDSRTQDDPGWEPCPAQPLLAWGLHPEASDRLRCAGITAGRITQTIGSAAASAGYHASDGTVDGEPYCAAVDLRARDMSEAEITDLLDRLGRNGFAAWYRKPGADGWPSSGSPHIHAVFAGAPMKSQLRAQVRDFLEGLNGLSSHTAYMFWQPPQVILDIVRLLFSRNYTP